ncbi:hypothetical protein GEMRC1_014008 [Eukaryota sp. GEM-RC1]
MFSLNLKLLKSQEKSKDKSKKKGEKEPSDVVIERYSSPETSSSVVPSVEDFGAVQRYNPSVKLAAAAVKGEETIKMIEKLIGVFSSQKSDLEKEGETLDSKYSEIFEKYSGLLTDLKSDIENESIQEELATHQSNLIGIKNHKSRGSAQIKGIIDCVSILSSLSSELKQKVSYIEYICERELALLAGCTQSTAIAIQSVLSEAHKSCVLSCLAAEDYLSNAVTEKRPVNGLLSFLIEENGGGGRFSLQVDQSKLLADLPIPEGEFDSDVLTIDDNSSQASIKFDLLVENFLESFDQCFLVTLPQLTDYITSTSIRLSPKMIPSYFENINSNQVASFLNKLYPFNDSVLIDARHFLVSLLLVDCPKLNHESISKVGHSITFDSFSQLDLQNFKFSNEFSGIHQGLFNLFKQSDDQMCLESLYQFCFKASTQIEGFELLTSDTPLSSNCLFFFFQFCTWNTNCRNV